MHVMQDPYAEMYAFVCIYENIRPHEIHYIWNDIICVKQFGKPNI